MTFFYQLILRKGISKRLLLLFFIFYMSLWLSDALKQLLFQQTVMIPNCTNTISKHGHWKNLRQGKDLNNWQKLIKAVGIYERNKLLLSKKYLSLKTRGWKKYLIQKVATLKLFSLTNQLNAFVSGVTLSNDNYRRKNFHTIILRSCCQTNLSWGCPDLL